MVNEGYVNQLADFLDTQITDRQYNAAAWSTTETLKADTDDQACGGGWACYLFANKGLKLARLNNNAEAIVPEYMGEYAVPALAKFFGLTQGQSSRLFMANPGTREDFVARLRELVAGQKK